MSKPPNKQPMFKARSVAVQVYATPATLALVLKSLDVDKLVPYTKGSAARVAQHITQQLLGTA